MAVKVKTEVRKFSLLKIKPMLSLGSFAIRDYSDIIEGTWWYEVTFLCIEFSWGYIKIQN